MILFTKCISGYARLHHNNTQSPGILWVPKSQNPFLEGIKYFLLTQVYRPFSDTFYCKIFLSRMSAFLREIVSCSFHYLSQWRYLYRTVVCSFPKFTHFVVHHHTIISLTMSFFRSFTDFLLKMRGNTYMSFLLTFHLNSS